MLYRVAKQLGLHNCSGLLLDYSGDFAVPVGYMDYDVYGVKELDNGYFEFVNLYHKVHWLVNKKLEQAILFHPMERRCYIVSEYELLRSSESCSAAQSRRMAPFKAISNPL